MPEILASSANNDDDACRRQLDRRKKHVKAMTYTFVKKRRRGPRRDGEQHNHYVDLHEPSLFFITLSIMTLCIVDAFFTLNILDKGGEEVNPFMKVLLERDVLLFFVVKFVLTSVFLIFAVIHKHFKLFNRVTGYQILYAVFAMYVTLVLYEIYLLMYQAGSHSWLA